MTLLETTHGLKIKREYLTSSEHVVLITSTQGRGNALAAPLVHELQ